MDIASVLYKINRWWTTGEINPDYLFKTARSELNSVIRHLDERRILSLIGPRRVGKSTLLYQTLDRLLRNGIEPKRLLFFSGDEPAFWTEKIGLSSILEAYFEDVLNRDAKDLESKVYIFIDEVHWLDSWQVHLKSFYDKRAHVKFIVSGSSSTHLFMDSRESLLGRIDDLHILPLNFGQFMLFSSVYGAQLPNIERFLQLLPPPGIRLFDKPSEYFESLWKSRHELAAYEARLTGVVKEYLLAGGYPEYFETKGVAAWQKKLSDDILQRGLYRDIVSVYGVKNPEVLERMVYYIAGQDGEHAYATIAGTLGVDVSTVSSYLGYLSHAFLARVCENYSPNAGKVIRKNKKISILDTGIRNALLRNLELSPEDEGRSVEGCCVNAAQREAELNGARVFFWREDKKEVDVVLDKKTSLLPIEVKYRNEVMGTLGGLRRFMEKFTVTEAVVVTKKQLEKKDGVYYVPFWLVDCGQGRP